MGTPKSVSQGRKTILAFLWSGIKNLARVRDFGGAPSDDVNSENIYHTT